MNDMIERASRAMCRLYYEKRTLDPIPPDEIDRLVDQMWGSWADEARAAIEATFTDDLQEVIEDAIRDAYPASVGYLATVALEALKRAAHDAILKEEGNG